MSNPVPGALDPVALSRRRMVTVACMIAQFMAAVESTIVATAMPTIVAQLGGFSYFSWVFTAYLLTQAVTIPIYGRLADIYGRKPVFFAGAGLFLVSSIACGFAWGMLPLIFFRTLQGFGAGAIQPIASTIIGDVYTPAERARIQGLLSSVWGVAAIIGPVLGAFIVEHLSWPLIFWINLPVGALAVLMLAVFLDEPRQPRRRRIDYLGAVLLMVGAGALMVVLVQGHSLQAWVIAGLLALGAVTLAALAVLEMRIPEPIVPFRLWRYRVIAVGNYGSFCIGVIMMGIAAYLTTYVQGVMGRSPTIAGLVVCTELGMWTFGSIGSGHLMLRTSYRWAGAVGGLLIIAGSAMLIVMTPASGPLWAAAAASVTGIGMGFCVTVYVVSLQASVDWSERGAATSVNMFMRSIGQAMGAALFGGILNFGIARYLPEGTGAVDRLLDPATRDSLEPGLRAVLTQAIAGALHEVYLIGGLFALVIFALTFFLPAGMSPTRPVRSKSPAVARAAPVLGEADD
jgi:EmrB/QacA subfamily drug resistance transporter